MIASHVAEHVPDLVDWLQQIHDVLSVDGELRLALPDWRFGFDVLRRETTFSDILTNHLLKARRPLVHNVLDFRLNYAPGMDGQSRYFGAFDWTKLRPAHSFAVALASGQAALDAPDQYFDVHCWVFQARTFATLMAQLCDNGMVRFRCARMIDTAPPLFEFYAFLTPCDDMQKAADSWRSALAKLHDPLPGSAEDRGSG